jgi:molybdopterin-containing oxidoreductase family iron-sulfur binding subunit
MMESKRRDFLKIAGLSALGLTTIPVLDALGSGGAVVPEYTVGKGPDALIGKHWGMVIDLTKLENVEAITEACHKVHNVPHFEEKRHEIKWIWETEYNRAFVGQENPYLADALAHAPVLVLCNHCENPSCVRACPTQATFKRESDGIVLMDFHRCIGCRFCMAACPFGARSFNFRDPRPFIAETNKKFPTRSKGVVEKCNFCAERLAVGLMPACVEASEGAIAFGDLDDPDSEIRELLRTNYTIRRKPEAGTSPSVYYIVGTPEHG